MQQHQEKNKSIFESEVQKAVTLKKLKNNAEVTHRTEPRLLTIGAHHRESSDILMGREPVPAMISALESVVDYRNYLFRNRLWDLSRKE